MDKQQVDNNNKCTDKYLSGITMRERKLSLERKAVSLVIIGLIFIVVALIGNVNAVQFSNNTLLTKDIDIEDSYSCSTTVPNGCDNGVFDSQIDPRLAVDEDPATCTRTRVGAGSGYSAITEVVNTNGLNNLIWSSFYKTSAVSELFNISYLNSSGSYITLFNDSVAQGDAIINVNISLPLASYPTNNITIRSEYWTDGATSSAWYCEGKILSNNSYTSENLNFTYFRNITRYLQIPQNVYLSNSLLNLSAITNSTSNISIYLGNLTILNYTNNFTSINNRTSNLANYLNLYISTCTFISSYCYIPFAFHSDTIGILQYSDLLFNNLGFGENSQSYNSSTYETSSELFNINLTYDPYEYTSISGTFYYDGTGYSGTRTGSGYQAIFTKTLDVPTIAQQINKTFYWAIGLTNTSGTTYYNTSFVNQTVSNISLSICGGTGGNIPYLNFTFKDETTDTYINASADLATWIYYLGGGSQTKTLIFTNTSVNPSYAFCFTPPHKTITDTLTFQYASSGYPQRQYYRSGTLSNTTTNQVLYLLGTASGIYSTYTVTNAAGTPISGATVTVERQFSGVWTQVSQGTTDSAGSVTFFLNFNYDHRITVVKTGYASSTSTVRPSQSVYTIILSTSSGNATYTQDLSGITWRVYPGSEILQPNTAYTFGFNVTAALNNLVNCKFEILLPNSTILSTTTGCSTNGGNISVSFNTADYSKIVRKFYLDTGSGYWVVDPIENWIDATDVSSFYTIKSFFQNLALYDDDFGETSARATYSKFIIFFFIVTILIGILTYFTGIELSSPGMSIFIFWAFIAIASLSGWFQVEVFTSHTNSASDWFNKYYIMSLITLFMFGFYINQWRRYNQ